MTIGWVIFEMAVASAIHERWTPLSRPGISKPAANNVPPRIAKIRGGK